MDKIELTKEQLMMLERRLHTAIMAMSGVSALIGQSDDAVIASLSDVLAFTAEVLELDVLAEITKIIDASATKPDNFIVIEKLQSDK